MTEKTLEDKVREWVTAWETTRPEHRTLEDAEGLVQALRGMLPAPTLEDMSDDERAECQWMQADIIGGRRAIITATEWVDGNAELLDRQGNSFYAAHNTVTPRPDLPRFVWPGEQSPEEEADA